jgi:RNA polymerase sigma-70 factor (ECF subfamily)
LDSLEQIQHTALVIKCQMGDRKALESLFLRHHRPMGYYLRRMLGREDVSDVQQEVWLTVIRRIARLKSPEAFVVWLYQIARNKAINRLTDRRQIESLESGDSSELPLDEPEPEFLQEDAARVHAGLAKLSPEHREVLLLRFMEDMTYEQMADVIGVNAGTVRSRLHYAKLALRRLLETRS